MSEVFREPVELTVGDVDMRHLLDDALCNFVSPFKELRVAAVLPAEHGGFLLMLEPKAKPKPVAEQVTQPRPGQFAEPAPFQSLGGQARAAKLTPERRSEIARKAGQTRWDKEKGVSIS